VYGYFDAARRGERRRNIVILSVVVGIVLLVFSFCIAYVGSVDSLTITVTKAERIPRVNRPGVYLVWTEQNEVFEIADSVLFWRWNSSDVYGQIEPGKTYRLRVVGWRVPILSWYRNILEARPIGE